MLLEFLNGKIHRATVTEAELDYVGSVTVDGALLDAAGIHEYEKVTVADINNGARLETYTIRGEAGSGVLCLNGAAARLCSVGDKVIIMSYARLAPEEIPGHRPSVVFVDESNRITKIERKEAEGERYAER